MAVEMVRMLVRRKNIIYSTKYMIWRYHMYEESVNN